MDIRGMERLDTYGSAVSCQSSVVEMAHSMVEHFSADRCSSCGYCKKTNMGRSHGMLAHSLTVDDYQSLIDRGWRRSGVYCYKPIMHETCCPAYTIRCDTSDFKLSKSQKKTLSTVNKFLSNDSERRNDRDGDQPTNPKPNTSRGSTESASKKIIQIDDTTEGNTSDDRKTTRKDKISNKPAVGPDPNRAPCKKAKFLRQEKKREKMKLKVEEANAKIQSREKSLEDFVNELPEVIRNRLQIKLVRTAPLSIEWIATESDSYQLYQKYQMIIHGDTVHKCPRGQYKRFLVDSPLKIKLVKCESVEFLKTFESSAALYQLYQVSIHNDSPEDCNHDVFQDFLVNSPLEAETRDSIDLGSFHQQYWLDGKLIAVGVIDILPKCVSSVYFYYDPSYGNLSLGTFGALREIEFTRKLFQSCSNIKYYYMGFYIHSCLKMKYKGNYSPSYLLCPETFEWFPFKESIEKLEKEPYSRLNPDIDAVDVDEFKDDHVDGLLVMEPQTMSFFTYGHYKFRNRSHDLEDEEMVQYGKLIGKNVSRNMIMVA